MNVHSLVTGATGFLGSHLVEALIRRGHRVRCLVRKTSDLSWLSGLEVDYVHGGLDDPGGLARAVADADYIFHCAGAIRARHLDEYMKANAHGSRRLAEAAAAHTKKLKRFVHVSSLAVTGPSGGPDPVDELTPCRPISDYGYSKYEGELEVWNLRDRIPVTIVRPPVIYGPRDRGVLNFFTLARMGWSPNIGGAKLFSVIYVDDLVEGILQAAESRTSDGETYFIANDDFVGFDEMLREVARVVGVKRLRNLYLRPEFLKALASANEAFMGWMGRSTFFNPDKVREIEQKYWICTNAKAKKTFGFSQKTLLKEGLRVTADWYRAQKWI